MVWKRSNKRIRTQEFDPDDILLDVKNLPSFDTQQFEGRLEKPISKKSFRALRIVMLCVCAYFVFVLGKVQIKEHSLYAQKSEQNSLDHIPVFADRGIIYDRNSIELVSNIYDQEAEITRRAYTESGGFSTVLGYVSYPAKDEKGIFWRDRTIGKEGIEKEFDEVLAGKNGTQLIEENVSGEVVSGAIVEPPVQGENIYLSIDAQIQKALYDGIKGLMEQSGYVGGAGAVMDIKTGELYALTSAPEYSSEVISLGQEKERIRGYLTSSTKPMLNRAIDGLYTPGSIVKPFLALAALQEGIISPTKTIFSDGALEIPNPYNPTLTTIFRDNKAHGAVDMRKALAVSSNIYFYQIGGGFGSQRGLGIANIEKYTRLFGMGEKTGINISGELAGNIPSIEWKARRFPGDPWRIGDTYNTAIGQYGFQVTPIQMVRAVGGLASRGILQTPTILKKENKDMAVRIPIESSLYTPVLEGMRLSVEEGTTQALNNPRLSVGAKSGTAQIKGNTRVNSWVIGFFPYENPRFAFTVLMEDGPKISAGAVHAMKPVVEIFASTPSLLSEE